MQDPSNLRSLDRAVLITKIKSVNFTCDTISESKKSWNISNRTSAFHSKSRLMDSSLYLQQTHQNVCDSVSYFIMSSSFKKNEFSKNDFDAVFCPLDIKTRLESNCRFYDDSKIK